MKKVFILLGLIISLNVAAKNNCIPNIILILADDQGWNGLSVPMDPDVPGSMSDYYQTPHLESLANEGMRFSRGYAPAPVCSPTRHSIQFGMSPSKTRVTYNNPKNIQKCDGVQAMASLIKKADDRYATAHFGKWHVSIPPDLCGYDESDGMTANTEGSSSKDTNDPKRTNEVTNRAVSFMTKKTKVKQPFFMQVSFYADHLAFRSTPEMENKYKNLSAGEIHNDPVFAGMNEDLDSGVGRILDAIKQLGISGNTYVVYMADNGYDESKSRLMGTPKRKAWPLSYSKGFVFEGGIRVPFIVKGPGIKAGTFSDVPVIGYDLMPTFLELIDSEFQLPKVVEGGSMVTVLKNAGIGEIKRPNQFMTFHYPEGVWPSQTSINDGDYKLIKTWAYDRIELFNLREDINESTDLSNKLPEKAADLNKILMNYLEKMDAILPPEKELEVDRNGILMKKSAPVSSTNNENDKK